MVRGLLGIIPWLAEGCRCLLVIGSTLDVRLDFAGRKLLLLTLPSHALLSPLENKKDYSTGTVPLRKRHWYLGFGLNDVLCCNEKQR